MQRLGPECRLPLVAACGCLLSVTLAVAQDHPREPLQLTWAELERVIVGKHVTLAVSGGVEVKGKVLSIDTDALVTDVKRTSDSNSNPKAPWMK